MQGRRPNRGSGGCFLFLLFFPTRGIQELGEK